MLPADGSCLDKQFRRFQCKDLVLFVMYPNSFPFVFKFAALLGDQSRSGSDFLYAYDHDICGFVCREMFAHMFAKI